MSEDVSKYDVIKTKEETSEAKYDEKCVRFVSGNWGTDSYPVGSIFLSLRRGGTVRTEFGGRQFTRVFEEIVLSPDGRIGVLEKIKSRRIA